MSTPVGDLFNQASTLDEQDRATLAGLLLESLEHEIDGDIESAWQQEIERRLLELDAEGGPPLTDELQDIFPLLRKLQRVEDFCADAAPGAHAYIDDILSILQEPTP